MPLRFSFFLWERAGLSYTLGYDGPLLENKKERMDRRYGASFAFLRRIAGYVYLGRALPAISYTIRTLFAQRNSPTIGPLLIAHDQGRVSHPGIVQLSRGVERRVIRYRSPPASGSGLGSGDLDAGF